MLKNAYFFEDVKNRFNIGGSVSELPLLLPPTITTLSSSFLTLNAVYYLQKRAKFASSKFIQLFFTSNSVVFVGRGRKNISCPKAQGTLATPLFNALASFQLTLTGNNKSCYRYDMYRLLYG